MVLCRIMSKTTFAEIMYRFLMILLSCDDHFLRSQVTQKCTYGLSLDERLPGNIERELAYLLERELIYQA